MSTVHVALGLTEDEYESALEEARRSGGGVDVSRDPGWHSHPALGIRGHLHGPEGRKPHTHRPVATWDLTPIPLKEKEEA